MSIRDFERSVFKATSKYLFLLQHRISEHKNSGLEKVCLVRKGPSVFGDCKVQLEIKPLAVRDTFDFNKSDEIEKCSEFLTER